MEENVEFDELVESWLLVESDRRLVGNKSGPTRLGFALSLKFFELHARFPASRDEFDADVVDFVADQVGVGADALDRYALETRTARYHREQIRTSFGFRVCLRSDRRVLLRWLADEVCPLEHAMIGSPKRCWRSAASSVSSRQRTSTGWPVLLVRCSMFDRRFTTTTIARLGDGCIDRLEAIVADPEASVLSDLKRDASQLGLDTLMREIDKLATVRAIELPDWLFDGLSDAVLAAWRARAMQSYRSDLLAAPHRVRITLLAVLCWTRRSEVTDSLVDLLIALVHKINAHADRKVERELVADLRRVRGKHGILFKLAGAALEHPDDKVRDALFPVVGERTLRDLVREAKANDKVFDARVRTVLRSSYSSYYRRMLPFCSTRCSSGRTTRHTGRSSMPSNSSPATPTYQDAPVSTIPTTTSQLTASFRLDGGQRWPTSTVEPSASIRAVRAGVVAQRVAAPRVVCRRCAPVAQPRTRSTRRFRRGTNCALRSDPSAARRNRVRRFPEEANDCISRSARRSNSQ